MLEPCVQSFSVSEATFSVLHVLGRDQWVMQLAFFSVTESQTSSELLADTGDNRTVGQCQQLAISTIQAKFQVPTWFACTSNEGDEID